MAESAETDEYSCNILELPHCVLTLLFSYLDTTSLYQLTRTCRLLKSLIEVPLLWRYVDARREPNTDEKIQYCTNRIHEKTTHVFFRAKNRNCGQVPPNFFESLNPFTNIKVLVLENQRLNGSKLALKDFLAGLEELSLKKTDIKCAEYFFQQSDKTMRQLRVLILDGCKWVTSSFFMSVAKYENLEIVSAVKCLRLHLDMVPYLSVARLHCKKLKIFDCRFTGIGHELLRSFYSKEAIQCLYFQSLKSSELDYGKKIFNNSYMRTVTYPAEANRMDSIICDESLLEYIKCMASKSVEPMPDSLLYRDPYPKCTCNYRGQDRELKPPASKITEDYYLCESPRQQLMKFVCQRHFADVQKLPDEFKEFFIANQKQFFTDTNSDVDSDSESSGSESDTSCCMYGMGRKMILLTPGNNHELHQEVLELNSDDHRDRPNFNIFIANPLGEPRDTNAEPDRAVASTSRSVSDNSINENIENSRNEAKRRHSESGDSPKGKKRKLNDADGSDQLNDEQHAAEVDALVESADDMGTRLNDFILSSLSKLSGRQSAIISWKLDAPSTSRAGQSNLDTKEKVGRSQEMQCKNSTDNPSENISPNTQSREETSQESCSSINGESSRTTRTGENNLNTNERVVHSNNTPEIFSTNIPETSSHLEGRRNINLMRVEETLHQISSSINGESSRMSRFRRHRSPPVVDPIQDDRNPDRRMQIFCERSRPLGMYFRIAHERANMIQERAKKKVSLHRLSLRGFKRITDVALDYIKNLDIDLLDLTYTSVTEQGIEGFLIHNPNCRIVHPLYCICKPINPFE